MNNPILIHISDLHVTLYNKLNGNLNEQCDSYLTTNPSKELSNSYITTFCEYIKKQYPDRECYLLISGDITNSAENEEFKFAEDFIKEILKELKINSENLLLIPGDHDIHRRSIINELEKNPTNEAHLLNEIKYEKFSKFYFNLKGLDFPINNQIVDFLNIKDRIIIIGLNSNFKINDEGGEGNIPTDKFREEMIKLKDSFTLTQLNFVLAWHHNISAGYEDKNSGQWEKDNRGLLLGEVMNQEVKLILNGNEHIRQSKKISGDSIYISDCGTLSTMAYESSFKVYEVLIDDDSVNLKNNIHLLHSHHNNDKPNYGYWDITNNINAGEIELFKLYENNTISIEKVVDILETNSIKAEELIEELIEEPSNHEENIFYNNESVSNDLYQIVREKKLFHSGHFHWSETSRAHNWIDISKLLESKEDLHFVKDSIIDVIETFDLAEDCDLIIGLGYEGNIISTKASIKYNKPYTSLPYSYRYNDHNEFEKNLNYENSKGEFKTVIIITDVVNDGRTIRKLIGKRCADFFEKVDRIIVISLFYTGDVEKVNTDILNYNKRLPNTAYDFENDHEVNNIEFYTVRKLKVDKCPYGKDYRNECLIYKDELSCVHLFYDVKEQKTI